MSTQITVGLIFLAVITTAVIKLLLGLKSDTRFLKYDFPQGWEDKIKKRYPLYNSLSDIQKNNFKKKVQMIIAKKKLQGLESLIITIDTRLAIASEMAFVTMGQKKLNLFKKLSPIAILPFEKYEEFKNRDAYTLYWDDDQKTLRLETDQNILLKGCYYLFMKIDPRFKGLDENQLEDFSRSLAGSTCPTNTDLFPIQQS